MTAAGMATILTNDKQHHTCTHTHTHITNKRRIKKILKYILHVISILNTRGITNNSLKTVFMEPNM